MRHFCETLLIGQKYDHAKTSAPKIFRSRLKIFKNQFALFGHQLNNL